MSVQPIAAVHAELSEDNSRIILVGAGPDYVLAEFAKVLKLATPLVKKSDPPGALILAASWPAVVQLSRLFGPAWRPGPGLARWMADAFEARAAQFKSDKLSVNGQVGLSPRPYQVEGALMIAATGRGLLFDDQGTGKTVTAILGLVERAETHPALPVVCVVPPSVVDPWVEHWTAWAPRFRAVAWRGRPAQRRALLGTADVYVVSYETARIDAADKDGPLMKLAASSVVVDEVHWIKSPYAMRSLAARRLAKKAANFVGLSGTPITHHAGNLWPTLEALAPLAYPSRERYEARYLDRVQGDYKQIVIGLRADTEPELRNSLLGQHRRVSKTDVLAHLPPKVYSVRTVELPEAWRRAYDAMEDQMLAELPDGEELSVMGVLAQLTRLSQLASSAAEVTITATNQPGDLIERTNDYGDLSDEAIRAQLHALGDGGASTKGLYSVRLVEPSWKVDELLEVLAERTTPTVTFAPSKQLIMLAGAAAERAGYQVGYVVGGQTMAERTQTVERFQAGKLDLLCATVGAGGVGLTLTTADAVVFLQSSWSLVERLQAEDRCHRIGSEIHDSIEIIDIVAKNTIDTRVRGVLREKAGHLSDLLQDPRIVSELLGGKGK